ncbi:coenzyme Q-binding protein COQ10 [Rhodoblastus acidophilus]|uniref:Coenzyme Q-binding protein COQ10 n=1 Tax=Rhodoblastus acidophilus TaxID=1074 RepID=A0A212R3X1_RHOAC|nr:type II toxin-antitoxin system RatA family toxin [Rhodoblastus acidophilus]PPQ40254.1 ubiquinone-binding protein [Rhodoblastus acidophilus]RAI19349.1 ubiquinone-binding protein [Rhodoblastus acidophilus]SNB66551.1 coenzyme Q-binding protein COQ10 [Rhodoblastus acidophilus]
MAVTRRLSRFYPRYSPENLFALAADIESYPLFVPGCRSARILAREGDALQVENVFGFGPLRHPFKTRAELKPPRELAIVSQDGPWRRFSMTFRFAREQDGCRLVCEAVLDFRSPMLNLVASLAAAEVETKVLAAFQRRAEKLFGP